MSTKTYTSYNIVVSKHDWDDAQRLLRKEKNKNTTLCSEVNKKHKHILQLQQEVDRLRTNRNEWMKHAQHLKQKLAKNKS